METVNSMTRAFGIHYKFPAGLQDTIKSLNDTVACLNEANAQASARCHARIQSLQGPHRVPSYNAIGTVLELSRASSATAATFAPETAPLVTLKAFSTLPNEHLHSTMRERYPVPTQLQFSQGFVPVVEVCVKRRRFSLLRWS